MYWVLASHQSLNNMYKHMMHCMLISSYQMHGMMSATNKANVLLDRACCHTGICTVCRLVPRQL